MFVHNIFAHRKNFFSRGTEAELSMAEGLSTTNKGALLELGRTYGESQSS